MASTRQRGGRHSARWRTSSGLQAEKGGFLDKKSALHYAQEQEALERRNIKTKPSETSMTLYEFVQMHWSESLDVTRQTKRDYERALNSHIIPVFGGTSMQDILPMDIEKWTVALGNLGLSPRTVEKHRNLLAAILKKAHQNGFINKNPFVGMRFKKAKSGKQNQPLTYEQICSITSAMTPQHSMLVWLGFWTGMRPSEALGLTLGQLDFQRGRIHIDRQLSRERSEVWTTSGLKTYKSKREIGFPRELQQKISEHVEKHGLGPQQLILQNRVGGILRYADAATAYRKHASRVGIPKGEGLHQLRHTCVSMLISKGAHPKEIQDWVGHASISETMDTYGHLFPNAMSDLTDKLNEFSPMPDASPKLVGL